MPKQEWFKTGKCDHPLSERIVVDSSQEMCKACGERFWLVAWSWLKKGK